METVYRRLCERLATADTLERALRHRAISIPLFATMAISIPLFATMPSRHCSAGLRGDARDRTERQNLRSPCRQLNAFATSNPRDEIVATDFVRQLSGQCQILPTSGIRHRGDEPRDDGLDKVQRPTRR